MIFLFVVYEKHSDTDTTTSSENLHVHDGRMFISPRSPILHQEDEYVKSLTQKLHKWTLLLFCFS